MKFSHNEVTHLHTNFHEDWMNFNGSDKSLKKLIDAKMAKNSKNRKFSAIFSDFLCNPSSDFNEILCAGASPDFLKTCFYDRIDSMMSPLLGFSKNQKNVK